MYLPTDENNSASHHKKKKNTKRWCKGKVGREHVPEITKSNYGYGMICKYPSWTIRGSGERVKVYICWHQKSCKVCGKVLEWTLYKDECPDSKE